MEAVGFNAASTASASALPLPITVISLVAIPPTKLEAPHRSQNPAHDAAVVVLLGDALSRLS